MPLLPASSPSLSPTCWRTILSPRDKASKPSAPITTTPSPTSVSFSLSLSHQSPTEVCSNSLILPSVTVNFKSFYFGCVLSTQETADSAPLNCQVQIQGYRNQQQVASQVATFTTDGLASSMDKVTLNSGFSNVDQVTFDTQGLNALLAGVLLDNLAYDVHLKKGKTIS